MARDVECPDGGTCHHGCTTECFRVKCCGPLSGVFPDDWWPVSITTDPRPIYIGDGMPVAVPFDEEQLKLAMASVLRQTQEMLDSARRAEQNACDAREASFRFATKLSIVVVAIPVLAVVGAVLMDVLGGQ